MHLKFVVYLFLFVVILNMISAEQITLVDLQINTNDTWCMGESNKLEIVTFDKDGNFTKVDSIRFIIENFSSYEQSSLYLKRDKYVIYVSINSSVPMNLSYKIVVSQSGQVLAKNSTVLVENCYQYSTITNFLFKIDEFITRYSVSIISISIVFLIIFIVAKIAKN